MKSAVNVVKVASARVARWTGSTESFNLSVMRKRSFYSQAPPLKYTSINRWSRCVGAHPLLALWAGED